MFWRYISHRPVSGPKTIYRQNCSALSLVRDIVKCGNLLKNAGYPRSDGGGCRIHQVPGILSSDLNGQTSDGTDDHTDVVNNEAITTD